jgi:hypothetical protein
MEGLLAEITRLTPARGEVLLVKFTAIKPQQVEVMRRTLNEFMLENFPGVRVLAVTGSIDVAVLSAECAAEIERVR